MGERKATQVGALSGRLAQNDFVRARTETRTLVGDVTMQRYGDALVAEANRAHVSGALVVAAGAPLQMVVVAAPNLVLSGAAS